jgi:hypothetical protein
MYLYICTYLPVLSSDIYQSIGKTEEEEIQRARRKLSILSDSALAQSLDQVNIDAKEEETTSVIFMFDFTYIYVCIYMYMDTYLSIYTYRFINMYNYLYFGNKLRVFRLHFSHLYMYIHTYRNFIFILYIHIYIYIRMYIFMYIYICIRKSILFVNIIVPVDEFITYIYIYRVLQQILQDL